VQIVLLHEFLEHPHSGTISTDDKVNVLKLSKDFWNDRDEQIYTLSVLKS